MIGSEAIPIPIGYRRVQKWEKEIRLEKQKKWGKEGTRMQAEWDAEAARRELDKPNPYLDEMRVIAANTQASAQPKWRSRRVEKRLNDSRQQCRKTLLNSGADPTLNVAEQIAELDGKITTQKNKHEEEWNAIQELKSSRDGQMSGFKEIIDKKKDVRAETLLSSG